MVQWLRFRLPMQGLWVPSPVRELRSHMPHSQKPKPESRSNTVTDSIKTLKKKKKKRAMDLKRPFSKEDTETANKYLKKITNITGH